MEGKEITSLDDVTLSEDTQVLVCNPDSGAGKTTLKGIQTATASFVDSATASTTVIAQGSDPSVSVSDTKSGTLSNHHALSFVFSLPRMESITKIEQTQSSTESGAENRATVTLTDGSTSTFSFYNGKQGAAGEKGDKGDSGVTAPSAGIFLVTINGSGHLIVTTAETTETTCPLSINGSGHLIYTI